MVFKRVTKWAALSASGLLVAGAVGLGVANAQGPAPQATPGQGFQAQVDCPVGQRGLGWRWGGTMPQTIAEALGMEPQDLTAAIQNGQTVTDLAKEKGIAISDLVNKILGTRQSALDQAVGNGRLTQEQADAMRTQMQENMTERLQDGTFASGLQNGTGAQNRVGPRDGTGPMNGDCPMGNDQARAGQANGFGRGMGR